MKTCFYTIYDEKNSVYAPYLRNSLKKFHPDIPLIEFKDKDIEETKIPRPEIFYLSAPYFAGKLMDEGYEMVVKIDVDSIVLGNLSEALLEDAYDVKTVFNWNRTDPKMYGEIGLATIQPQEYFNNGFVVLTSRKFVKEWMRLCKSSHQPRMPFREQGWLNILAHYCGYSVVCLDNAVNWWGLRSKGEWHRCIVRDNSIVLPQGPDGYPDSDKTIKVIHFAGGDTGPKMNYKIYFSEECITYIDNLVKE
jgi:lipopolysaccharide biosynthesis glycosyltransferase